jgi:thiol-disulfide isomerase/thioredoxin
LTWAGGFGLPPFHSRTELTARLICAIALVAAALPRASEPADLGLERYRGKVLVLNFWATWCAPCRNEMPLLVAVQSEYGPRGVQVVGPSIDEPEDRETAERFAREMRVNYPVLHGHTTEDMKPLGLATAIPATAIFDRDGRRVFRIIGEVHEDAIRSRLDWLLSDRTAAAPPELVLPPGVTPEHFAQHEAGIEEDEDEHHAEGEHEEEGGSAVPT